MQIQVIPKPLSERGVVCWIDKDGRLRGSDAVVFFERSGLPRDILATVRRFSAFLLLINQISRFGLCLIEKRKGFWIWFDSKR